MRTITLQTATETMGGSPATLLLAFFGLLLTVCLSLVVAYLIVNGYRRNRNRSRLYLAVGLLFLTTGPIVFQFLLTNFTTMSQVGRSAVANASKLLGLGAMLYAIYGQTGRSRARADDRPIQEDEP